MMKAIQFNQDFVADVMEFPIPEADGEKVIVKVSKCGICGSDLHMFEHGSSINHGVRPGHEFSGIVLDPGARSDLKKGDRVVSNFMNPCGKCSMCKSGNIGCCEDSSIRGLGLHVDTPGGMAEYVACFPDYVYKLPDDVDLTLGALTDPIAVALHAVNLGKVGIGSKVLVTGGGSVGLAAALLAKKAGATLVVVTEIQSEKLKNMSKVFPEIDAVFDGYDPNLLECLLKISNGGFDVCIECSGDASATNMGIYATCIKGSVVLAGVSVDNISISTVYALIHELTIQGSMAYLESEYITSIHLLNDPVLNFRRLIGRKVSFDEVTWAMKGLFDHTLPDYKIFVDIDGK